MRLETSTKPYVLHIRDRHTLENLTLMMKPIQQSKRVGSNYNSDSHCAGGRWYLIKVNICIRKAHCIHYVKLGATKVVRSARRLRHFQFLGLENLKRLMFASFEVLRMVC